MRLRDNKEDEPLFYELNPEIFKEDWKLRIESYTPTFPEEQDKGDEE